MTYSTFIGVLLIAISVAMYYFTNLDYTRFFSDKEFLVGITGGAGIGFILGGFLGVLIEYLIRIFFASDISCKAEDF